MKLLGLIGLLLLASLLAPAGHRCRHRAVSRQRCLRAAPVQVTRSPWAARAPKTVRRVSKMVNK